MVLLNQGCTFKYRAKDEKYGLAIIGLNLLSGTSAWIIIK